MLASSIYLSLSLHAYTPAHTLTRAYVHTRTLYKARIFAFLILMLVVLTFAIRNCGLNCVRTHVLRCNATGQPIFMFTGYTNCTNPDSIYYDPGCLGCFYNSTEATFAAQIGGFWSGIARDGSPGKEWPLFDDVVEGENFVLKPSKDSAGGTFEKERYIGREAACALWRSAPADAIEASARRRSSMKPGWGRRKPT